MIIEPAPAKVNLALHVRRRRADGYHDLETLFAFARDGDGIRVETAEQDAFTIIGPFATTLQAGPDNLVLRARDAFRSAFGGPAVAITLDKNLPVASGIGGGSADAAATLRALARLAGTSLDHPRLDAIARALGADVPACLRGTTALGTGRGDDLQPVDGLSGTPLLLVNPGVPVSTAQVFARWDGVDRGAIGEGDLLACIRAGRNDLQPAARALAPLIDEVLGVLADMSGALVVRMSGSGATCFALFGTTLARDAAVGLVRRRGWWTLATTLA